VKRALQSLPLLPALLLAMPAMAQGIDLGAGGPVEVTARGTFEIHDQQQEVIAEGDARAVRGATTVLADRMIARYRKRSGAGQSGQNNDTASGNEVYRLEAHGHVRIVTPTDEAVGDDATYDLDQAALAMTGKALRLSTPTSTLTARDSLEYWSGQHMAVGRGNAVVISNDGRRVSADVLVAYTDQDAQPPAAAGKGRGELTGDAGKLKRVDAFGNVEVRTAQDIVRGDNGLYLPQTGQGRVVGHVRITRGDNQINGPAADFDMKTGVARIVAQQGARVEGLIAPNSATKPGAPAAKAPAGAP
jgi:lipopolysaccharide export system protein LptA